MIGSRALVIALALSVIGCATSEVTVYRPGEATPAARIAQNFAGRGCLAVDTSPDSTSVLIQQDGTSDWSLSRLFAMLGDVAGGVFGGARDPQGMTGPSDAVGCRGVLEGAAPAPQGPPPAAPAGV